MSNVAHKKKANFFLFVLLDVLIPSAGTSQIVEMFLVQFPQILTKRINKYKYSTFDIAFSTIFSYQF